MCGLTWLTDCLHNGLISLWYLYHSPLVDEVGALLLKKRTKFLDLDPHHNGMPSYLGHVPRFQLVWP